MKYKIGQVCLLKGSGYTFDGSLVVISNYDSNLYYFKHEDAIRSTWEAYLSGSVSSKESIINFSKELKEIKL